MNTTPSQIKIIIADDHELFRVGLRKVLLECNDIGTILEAVNGKELLDLVKEDQPDVVLLDLDMPVINGLKAMTQLHRNYPTVRVIVVSMYKEADFVVKLIKEGASAYLLKDSPVEEVIKAIRSLAAGEEYHNELVAKSLIHQIRERRRSHVVLGNELELSNQEEKLLRHVAKELTNSEIADKMNLSVRTIEYYRARLMQKIGVKNTAGLMAFALKHILPEQE